MSTCFVCGRLIVGNIVRAVSRSNGEYVNLDFGCAREDDDVYFTIRHGLDDRTVNEARRSIATFEIEKAMMDGRLSMHQVIKFARDAQ